MPKDRSNNNCRFLVGKESNTQVERIDVLPLTFWWNRYACSTRVWCRPKKTEGDIQSISKDKPRGANHEGKDSLKQTRLRKKIIEKTTRNKLNNATPLIFQRGVCWYGYGILDK